MSYETIATTFLEKVFLGHTFNGSWLLMQCMLIIVCLIIITRKPESWFTLAFPMALGWHLVGFNISIVTLIITGIMFTISGLSQRGFGGAIGTVASVFNISKAFTPKAIKNKYRMDKLQESKLSYYENKYKPHIKPKINVSNERIIQSIADSIPREKAQQIMNEDSFKVLLKNKKKWSRTKGDFNGS